MIYSIFSGCRLVLLRTRAGNEPSGSLKFYNHRECLLLIESDLYSIRTPMQKSSGMGGFQIL